MKTLRSLTTTYTMSLLAKKFSFSKILKPGLIMLIPVFFGCDSNDDLGIQYDLGSNANVRFQEFTLPASNIYVDSLRTDGENRVLVGSYNDQLTGNLYTEGYLQFSYLNGPLPSNEIEGDTLEVDSIIVTLRANTTLPQESGIFFQEFSLFDLEDSLQAEAIYLASNRQTTDTIIGTFSSNVNTLIDSVYQIKMNEGYTQSFYATLV